MNKKPFAEVIESSLDSFIAQCWQWDNFPEFGSLVQVNSNDLTILGCVYSIQTGSMDPMRYPFPYQKTEKELLSEQPQIFEFLKTTFNVKILGYINKKKQIKYHIPPHPSKIHSFVEECLPEIETIFFNKQDFLYLLFNSSSQISNFDDLLLTIISKATNGKKPSSKTLSSFYQTLSLLTGNDYRRMKLFLRRVEQNKVD